MLVQKKRAEYLSKLTPEEKAQFEKDSEDAQQRTVHCLEDGIVNPVKIKVEEFVFLKSLSEDDYVNKVLIQNLAFYSLGNIVLRYLLIEAGQRNKQINKILMNVKYFYQVPNNPKEFYTKPDGYIPDNERLNPDELNLVLAKLDIKSPAAASKEAIINKISKTFTEKKAQFIKKIEKALIKEIEIVLRLNPNQTIASVPDFLSGIESTLSFFFNSTIDNEFNRKSHRKSEGLITYLNEMYWLDEEKISNIIDTYLFLQNFTLNVAEGVKQIISISSIVYKNKESEIENRAQELEAENKGLNCLLSTAQTTIQKTRKKNKMQANRYTVQIERFDLFTDEMKRIIRNALVSGEYTFSTGKINYTKLGSALGVTNKTAKRWVEIYKSKLLP